VEERERGDEEGDAPQRVRGDEEEVERDAG
jgi:hypothetical protein